MISRERILEAATRVYAQHGFRGATTRLIAIEAGVNEVTLFRTFGSKGALLEAVLASRGGNCLDMPSLPDMPGDPATELTAWVQMSLERIGELRPMLIQTMSELELRPEAVEFACRGRHSAHDALLAYATRLQDAGVADRTSDVGTAVTMLTSALIGDVMGRPMAPTAYPAREDAAGKYVACFLRAIGAGTASGSINLPPCSP